jgi:hypothetical protein
MMYGGRLPIVPSDRNCVLTSAADTAAISGISAPEYSTTFLRFLDSSAVTPRLHHFARGPGHVWTPKLRVPTPRQSKNHRTGLGHRCRGTLGWVNSLLQWGGDRPVTYRLLAGELARPPYCLALLSVRFIRRLLIKPTPLHFPENAFALHFLFEDSKSLLDIVISDKDLQLLYSLRFRSWRPVDSWSRLRSGSLEGWRNQGYFEFATLTSQSKVRWAARIRATSFASTSVVKAYDPCAADQPARRLSAEDFPVRRSATIS